MRNGGNRHVAHGSADSGAMKDLGKPDEGKPHVRIDEGRLETGPGFGTAAPATSCVDSAGPQSHRASLLLYPAYTTRGLEQSGLVQFVRLATCSPRQFD